MTNREAIEILSAYYDLDDYRQNVALDMAILALRSQELANNSPKLDSGNGEWIPVSERFPEKCEKAYWVCLETGGQCQCRWSNDMYGLGSNKWSKWGWHIMDKPQYSKVIAWMPLPEPYQEESE